MLEATLLGRDASPGILLHSRHASATSHKRHGRSTLQSNTPPIRHITSNNNEAEEELVWSRQTVTWSRGCEVYRQFSFEDDKEDVAYALFTPFRRGRDQPTSVSYKGKEKERQDVAHAETFGPFHTAHSAHWGQATASPSDRGSRLERALMIFLQTKAYIYFPSGEDIVVHLPFVIEKAWPLSPGGVMVQRALEKRELRRLDRKGRTSSLLRGMEVDVGSTSILDGLVDLDDEAEDLPRVWTLSHPFEEFKMVTEAGLDERPAIPNGWNLLYVGDDTCPLVVAHDPDPNEIHFYRPRNSGMSSAETRPVQSARTMRPEEILRPRESLGRGPRPSLGRNPGSFAPSKNDRRQSGKADPLERTTRRAPRLSRSAVAEKEPPPSSATGELHAALDPPPFAVTVNQAPNQGRRVVSGASSITVDKSDRRGSGAFMREDMHAMDKGGLYALAEKDLRETTMLMGLERQEQTVKSEIVFEKITSWAAPPSFRHARRQADFNVFVTENFWPESVWLNIHYSTELLCCKYDGRTISAVPTIPCIAATPILCTRHDIYDALILEEGGKLQIMTSGGSFIPMQIPTQPNAAHEDMARQMAASLSMQIDGAPPVGPAGSTRQMVGVSYPAGTRATLIFNDGESVRASFDFRIKHRLVRQCCEALTQVLPVESYYMVKRELLDRLRSVKDGHSILAWHAFIDSIKTVLRFPLAAVSTSANKFDSLLSSTQQSSNPILRRLAAKVAATRPDAVSESRLPDVVLPQEFDYSMAEGILFCLHIVAQDSRCTSERQSDLLLLAPLLSELSGSLAATNWWDYWQRLVPSCSGVLRSTTTLPTSMLDSFDTPPDILHHLTLCLTRKTKPFPIPRSNELGDFGRVRPFKTLEILCDIYANLSDGSAGIAIFKAHETINKVIRHGLTPQWIQSLSFGVAMPIMEALRMCQHHPSKSWTPDVYAFVGRPDYASKTGKVADGETTQATVNDEQPTIGSIMAMPNPEKTATPEISLPHVRFGSDRRVAEVERILQTTRVRTIAVDPPKGISEQDLIQYHQSVVNTIANRTLSITVASGIFEYGTRRTTVTDAWEIAPIELSVKVLPGTSVLKAQLVAENADWPCFHNGVSAALAISPECKGIDSSWIVFNRPQTLNSEHGGFLLGLGLNGHLRSLMAYHAFPYMEPRHDYTSCGLLLGLACSFAGSQDQLCTKVLSLHTHALLPLGSAELNASPTIQSTALMGLGLVHAGSRNLRIAEVILSEIGRQTLPGVEAFEGYQEAYSFSASMAFGLIMLGRGGQQSSEIDRRLVSKLRRCIVGEVVKSTSDTRGIDTTMTAPGATLALGLMYLKTGQREIADMLVIPQSPFEADHIRPDMLMLRVLAQSLIMWDGVNASLTWIESQLPPYLQKAHKGHRKTSSMEIASELAYFYIITGACFAIGLKLAGTGSELAHNNLIFFFGMLSRACSGSSMTYEGRLRRHAARQCLNIVTLALATVMSGTGELNVLRRLRVSHGQEGAGVTYGTHMANHMACGILFLGRGHYTLGNSNLAIAALSIAFFPRFLASPSDNKAYPQAFRHLWALAAEPRCLIARDVDTNETVYLPVRLRSKGGLQAPQSHISPTLIAPFDTLNSIETESPRYWPILYDLTDPSDKQAILRQRTMYVKRKAAYLDYNTDPKGNRSMVLRAGSISGFDTHYDLLAAAAPPSLPASEIEDLLASHSGIPELIAMVQRFATDLPFDKFVRNVLLECVSHDKPKLVGTYLAIWLALHCRPELRVEHMTQLSMMREFYTPTVFSNYTISSSSPDRRLGWIRTNFLSSATRKIADVEIGETVIEGYFAREEWKSEMAGYCFKNNVPPLEFLKAVRNLVSRSGGEEVEVLETKVRNAARGYAQAVQRRYVAGEGDELGDVKVWKAASVSQAVRIWLRCAGDE